MKIRIDLSKNGLAMFFKPYEIMGWDVVWKSTEPIGSGSVWDGITEALGPDKSISRASVIFFLNRQVDLEFMGWKDGTGKGGHHRRYYPLVNMTELALVISRKMAEKTRDLIYQAIEFDKGVLDNV